MGKRTRKVKVTVFGSVEGKREKLLLNALIGVYKPRDNNINPSFNEPNGGTPESLVKVALDECSRDRAFAWFDQDFEPEYTLSKDMRENLARHWNITVSQEFYDCPISELQTRFNANKRKPILIISQPGSVEALILRIFDVELPFQNYAPANKAKHKADLKSSLAGLIGVEDEDAFYHARLTKELLDEKRTTIKELDLLISMIAVK